MQRKLGLLSILYLIQGMPYGFQLVALPVYLRAEGMSLTGIGLASALALPWSLKIVWGPLVDRFGSARFGRRRTWILPLQAALALSCAAVAFVPPERGLLLLLLGVLAMNLFAATMDVAVDGLAVDLLKVQELGYGNIAQVVGYKLGILTGGGLLVWASDRLGWRGLFLAMAGVVVAALLVTLGFQEPSASEEADATSASVGGVLRALTAALRVPGSGWLLLFIATYKLGEAMADAMFKPLLFDAGIDAAQIGLWVGTWGTVFSLAGSFLGGILASRMRLLNAVAATATLRALAVASEWWLAAAGPTVARLIPVTALEQLFGGALTTAMFAFMMSRVDRRIGASHYTLLATVEVTGKIVASWGSGVLADRLGYPPLFALATALSVAFLTLLLPMHRAQNPKPASPRPASPEAVSPDP